MSYAEEITMDYDEERERNAVETLKDEEVDAYHLDGHDGTAETVVGDLAEALERIE